MARLLFGTASEIEMAQRFGDSRGLRHDRSTSGPGITTFGRPMLPTRLGAGLGTAVDSRHQLNHGLDREDTLDPRRAGPD
jgi:hypothetical protein